MKLPKVLIFTPIYEGKDYCLDEWLENIKNINYPNKRHIVIDNSKTTRYFKKLKKKLPKYGLEVYHVARGNNSRESLSRAQTFARRIAIDEGYDYLFSLESDIIVSPEIVQVLLSHGLDVVSGLYMLGDKQEGVQVPCITKAEFNKQLGSYGTRLLHPEEYIQYINAGLKQVVAGGMGCCLISRKIFKDIGFYYDPRFQGHSDVYFFNELFWKKIPMFVDTDMVCDHRNSDWLNVKDR